MSAPGRSDRVRELWRARPRSSLVHATILLLAGATAWVWLSGEVALEELFSARRTANLERFLTRDAIPFPLRDGGFSWAALRTWAAEILEQRGWEAAAATLWISVLAIVLAGALGIVLAPLAAHTLLDADPYADSSRDRGLGWRAATTATRALLIFLRAIPEYVWAFLLLAMLGPSAWPVVIALALHNAGILGRLGAETIENLDPHPLRALAATGAGRRRLFVAACLPLALPRLLLYFFYRFETCVREATVLGMLGTVSLGYWIQDSRGRQRYDEMLLFVALGAVLVVASDVVSFAARRWIRRA